MNILHVVGVEYKKGNGITVVTHELLQELNLKGIQAELLLLTPISDLNPNYVIHQNITNYNVFFKIHHYDLVVFNGLYYLDFIKIAKELKKNGIPYLVKPHSSLMRASHKKSWIKKKLSFIIFFNKFINDAYALLFSNDEERKNSIFRLKKYYIETNGVTLNFNKNLLENGSCINLLFLSRIDFSHKGIDYLIEGFKKFQNRNKLDNVKLNIYGSGDQTEVSLLTRLIENVQNISFHGPVFGKEKDELLDRSDILILTSRYEGFPTIFIEVLNKGLPIIMTPGTNATFFEKDGVGWISQLTSESIAETIKRAVVEYTRNKQEIRHRCKLYSLSKFDIRKTVNESINIYNDVLNKSK